MTLFDPVHTYACSRPESLAIVDIESNRQWTYAALDVAIDRLAGWIVDRFGEQSETRIATLAKNCTEMLTLQLACARAGAIFVPFNWRLAHAEIEALAADAEPKIVFHDPDMAPPSGAEAILIQKMLELGDEGGKIGRAHV